MKATFSESEPVVIIGGGFAGLITALSLNNSQNSPPIILFDSRQRFVFLPLLYELLSDELKFWEVGPTYKSLLAGKGISFIQDSVEGLDMANKTIRTFSGQIIQFGQLVISTGSQIETYGIPGVSEYALKFNQFEDVAKIKQLLNQLNCSDSLQKELVIVGAGASGIELACKSSDLLNDQIQIHLIESGDQILPNGKSFNKEQALLALDKRKIRLHLNTKVLKVTSNTLEVMHSIDNQLHSGLFNFKGLIWTAGSKPLPPPGLPKEIISRGGISIKETLQVVGINDVFAIGDVAIDKNNPRIATAQLAIQQAQLAAKNIIYLRTSKPLENFKFLDRGEILSLGIGEATITALGLTLSGPLAFQLRRLAYLSKIPSTSLGLRSAGAWLIEYGKNLFNLENIE